MNLEPFGWSIGISDLLGWRECPTRMMDGMRRHVGDESPEAVNWTNAFGSAVHHAIYLVDTKAMSHEDAIREVMREFAQYLTPEDSTLLRENLAIFEKRRPLGVQLIAAEQDMRVPLFVYDGTQVASPTQIYFRFKVDVLYRLIAYPDVFLARDYKSSRHAKTAEEVHSDLQQFAYNWALHERYPECRRLFQTYDQLRFGAIPTTKTDEQRLEIKQWLIDVTTAMIEDTAMKPKLNEWCRYCERAVTCPEPRRASRYTRGRMAVLAPLTKEGRKVRVMFAEEGDELEHIIEKELPAWQATKKHIEHVEKELKAIIGEMTVEDRERLHWRIQERNTRTISPDGLRELHALMGDSFFELVSLSITKLEELVGKPKKGEPKPPELALADQWTMREVSATSVVRTGT
jgi:hypothetical protein